METEMKHLHKHYCLSIMTAAVIRFHGKGIIV